MTLHNNKTLFKEAVLATATQKNLPDIYIEKDYWVTLALYTIFKSDIGSQTHLQQPFYSPTQQIRGSKSKRPITPISKI